MLASPFVRLMALCLLTNQASAEFSLSESTGRELMTAVYDKHRQYPYVYEEYSMVLIDREGNRETRKAKVYTRVEADERQRLLLLFESPEDVRGVAVLAERSGAGDTRQAIYLPSLGDSMVENSGEAGDANFLGTDFSVENLTGEQLEDYRYERRRDVVIKDKMYSIVDVFPGAAPSIKENDVPLRRHFVSQDNLYVTRTDYYDDLGRVRKRQSHHDLTQVLGEMWRANMLLMENLHSNHQTLIKIDRRVFSKDYVPKEVFTEDYLFANGRVHHPPAAEPDAEAEAELIGGAQ